MIEKVYILRGPTGLRKSTWAKEVQKAHSHVTIFCADDYRMKDGEYQFDPKDNIPHARCFLDYMDKLTSLSQNREILIVDNTNLAVWELAPYVRLAEVGQHLYTILQFIGTPEDSYMGTTHDVPLSKIVQMHNLMITERLPPHWKTESILSKSVIATE